jgi:phosphoglycolate phosphatase
VTSNSFNCEAIFFDLDGTMFDTAPELVSSVNRMLDFYGLQELSFKVGRNFIGKGVDNLISQSLQESGGYMVNLKDAKSYFGKFYSEVVDQSDPYEGVIEMLEYLSSKKVRLACVTNKPSGYTNLILKKNKMDSYFEVILCGDQMKFKKPDPYPINLIQSELGISKDNILMVGDSSHDIQSALSAGVKIATVPYGYQFDDPIENFKIDFQLNNFFDLKKIFH